MARPPLVVVAGPTASGKSALARALAKAWRGVVVNADASQLYRDLRVLTARPTPEEEAEVPHALYGILDGDETCSAARWAELAAHAIAEARATGRLPILVGGTGLYLATLVEGIAPVPPIPPDVRAAVRALPADALRAALAAEDPVMAARLHPGDRQRQARALEVVRATGRSLAHWHAERTGGIGPAVALDIHLLLPDRATLARRIDRRIDHMLQAGALEEVRRLAARGLAPDRPVMKALGVRPLLAHLAGATDLATAVARLRHETRAYAKRQRTWFATGGRARGWLAAARRWPSAEAAAAALLAGAAPIME
ncbi:MAG: tRNA (adenosine(37)-N6)-dimethylallyltransferase MiaA [Sphingomonadaceae bacterium]|uniref:tRNA (adenosine(37)-N6)-dimethylallyltransferase MiaA n=1 Tax=Thermaurantiacus sp. TaxID=2820283 RepID=UPI00298F1C16|nr:tRNA (adenosine(37)-N6)-dimethylallyltransferase MiaA [Thermaurantiacus sp.]MCS6987045.1 tRNA (adenosine(37)-N6)-dimethylallyltransferase MiaA [Sphingomonadaceae bacterium]MDW8415617.1 tRNA (adenosine(37)-N6)-dimethylallyltransferase MiaA [Thermaurantiacus sp.]